MQRVLVLSDNAVHTSTIAAALRADGRVARAEASPERFLIAAREWRPSLAVVDLSAGLTAAALGALLRDNAIAEHVPVIALAERDDLRLVGPGVKVDDVIVAPIDEEEVRLRVARALWRRTGTEDGGHVVRHGPLTIDLERYTVTVDGEPVDLTYKEYELLRFLATNPGRPFTREALLNRVWGYDYYGGSRTVDVHIRRIRAKIEGQEQFIETVRNVGYRFIERK